MKTTITQNQIFRNLSRLQRSCCSAVFLLLFLLSASSSWGQIAQRGTATTAISTSASVTVNRPTGVVAGDIMFANIGNYIQATQTSASCAGWTLIAGTDVDRGRATLLYKIAGGSEPANYTFTVTASSSAATGAIVAFSGVDFTNPFDVTAPNSWYTATSTTLSNIPSITTSSANAAVLMFGNCTRVTTQTNSNFTNLGWTSTSPSSLTELYDVGHSNVGNTPCVGAAWALKPTAGATGLGGLNCNVNTSPRTLGGLTLALKAIPPGTMFFAQSNSSYSLPCYVKNVSVRAWGAGGAGGGVTDFPRGGGGGEGGSFVGGTLSVSGGESCNITVGTGGVGGTGNGGAGGFSQFVIGSTTHFKAIGGTGGAVGNSFGAGGNSTNSGNIVSGSSQVTFYGGNGGTATSASTASSGGGGGSAGNGGDGGAGGVLTGGSAGSGTPSGAVGATGRGSTNDGNGNTGNVPGAGGSGARNANDGTDYVGGNGGNGLVVLSWTCPSATIAYSASSYCKSVTSATVTITGTDATTTCSNTFSYTGTGTLSLNTTTGAINPSTSTVGTYTVTYALPAQGGCAAVSATATVTINALPTVTSATGNSKTYTGTTNATTVSAVASAGATIDWYDAATGGNLLASGTLTYAPTGINAGSYTVYAQARNTTTECTSAARTSATLTINKAVLTITAGNQTVSYGTAVATVTGAGTYTPTGFVNNETSSVIGGSATYTTTYTATTAAGTAGVTITPVIISLTATNYSFSAANGAITISTAPLTITASNASKCFGTTYTLGSSAFTSSGLQNSETIGSVTFASTGAASNGSVGTHPIVPSVATGQNFTASNYSITYSNGTLTVNALPTVTASANQSVCAGSSVTLSGGGATSYSWNNGISNGVAFTPSATTTYTVTGTDGNDCINTASTTVTVNPILTASVSIASNDADNTICSGTSVTFTATPTNGGTTPSYQWKVNGTNAGTNAATFTSTTLAYNDVVTCVMTSNASPCLAGSPATSNTVTMVVNASPNPAYIASNVAALCGGTATLSASTNDANVGVKWYNSANSWAGTGYSLNVTPQSGTILTYYAQAYNLTTGCTALNNTAVQVIPIKQYTGSGNWDNANSWTCGSVPTANDQAVIPSGSTVTIASADAVANTLTVGGSLTVNGTKNLTVTNEVVVSGTVTVNSNANLLQINPNAANSGNITVNRNSNSLNRLDYTLWSSPVLNRNLFGFSPATVTTRFYMYDTANRSYVNKNIVTNATLTNSDVFQIGRGYLIRTPNNWVDSGLPQVFQGVFTGKPNNGTITVPLVDAGSSAENKYNLVGNPYPSAISIDEFVRVNQTKIDGTIYLWRQTYSSPTSSAYCVFNSLGYQSNGDANAGDPVVQSNTKSIPVGQGFFVKAIGTNSGASVEFNNDMRVASSNGHFHRTMELEKHRIWLNATSSTGLFSQMLLGYVQDATNGVDSKFDGTSMGDGSIVLTSTLEAKQYAIQGRALPFDNQDIVPLSFKATTAGNYTFTLAQMDGLFAAGQDVFIKDKELEKIHNLKESAYTFSANAGTFANRFEILFQATLTDLQANSCGATIANMSSLVYADIVNGATGYRFKVVNNTTSAVQTIDRPQHWFAFNMLSAYDYNTPYTISVQVQKDGVWTGYYGTSCTVNSPNIASTGVMQINPSQCGMTLPTLGTVIATTPVAGATGYKFRITNTTAGAIGNNLVQEITRTNHWFTLGMLSRYNYGSSYAIEVAVKTTGGYTPYGNACTVYAPTVPTLASCGQTVATSTTLVRTTVTTLATQYRFQVTRIATQETITFDTANYWFSFRVNVPGYAAGEQYGVRVAVMTAGAWSPYGDACDITAPIATARTTEEAAPSEANLFKPVAYPNPFASTFGISLATPSADVIHLMVYDLQGRLIEKQNVFVSQLDSLQIGTNYPSGDYLLVVAQGANIKSSHIHKD